MGPYNTGTPAFFYAGILLLTLHFQKSTSSSTSTPTDNSAATTNETWSRASLVTQMTESSSAPGKHPAQTTSHSTHEILSTVTEMNKVSTLVSTLVSTPAQGQTTQSWTTQGSRLERSTTQRTSSDTATPTESPATQSEVTVQNTNTKYSDRNEQSINTCINTCINASTRTDDAKLDNARIQVRKIDDTKNLIGHGYTNRKSSNTIKGDSTEYEYVEHTWNTWSTPGTFDIN
nr:PREDICTED: mucin-22-like [Latimeria chalumnae]|eukprot:XP_014352148.1 PREDICTED: mucin-22-like [Latimeria chalumnae]